MWYVYILISDTIAKSYLILSLFNLKCRCYTPCPKKKTCDYIFYNNFNNRCPSTVIFGIVSSKSMRHRISFPISPI